ncbi:hypothetical protein Q4Q39_10775 [Flavivirga amylovorans]|uniref:SGNH/GDSL hydrolase family protein n=1 Tax=Flavivirga amylovorans TaxID=870486 RepID=A0ABT8X1Q7_9FLAO|nr:hypothetical protein [Flavivirga amylovorans]MDO5987885.1 hypothetical protein [Flavivirga amylovorans]
MKLLIIKLSIFFVVCFGIITVILMNYGGNVDYFYQKFTTPKVKSIIIGDSRSFQGIQPSVINQYFHNKNQYDLPVLNYSFTGAQAISGPLYTESILKKIDKTATNGLFIISITPDFLTSKDGFRNDLGEFRESNQPPHNMNHVDVNPNYEYLLKNMSYFHFKALFRKNSETHKDGWLEESNLPTDTLVFDTWRKHQIDLFLDEREMYKISDFRVNSFNTLIKELKKFGKVYLIRMPISKEFLNLENSYYPELNAIVDSIAKINETPFFDFNNSGELQYKTYDGHHIDKHGGKEFTKALCDSITQK